MYCTFTLTVLPEEHRPLLVLVVLSPHFMMVLSLGIEEYGFKKCCSKTDFSGSLAPL